MNGEFKTLHQPGASGAAGEDFLLREGGWLARSSR